MITLASFFILHAHAQNEITTCAEVSGLVCEFYDRHANERFFEMPGGTFVTNVRFRAPKKTPNVAAPVASFGSEAVLTDLMDILDVPTIPAARTKLVLGLSAREIFDQTSERVTVPWPLDSPRARPRTVDREAVMMSMRTALGPQRLEKLRRFVNQTRNRIEIDAQARAMETLDEGARLTRERFGALYADPARIKARQDQVRALFARAKIDVIATLTAGRPRAAWDADERNMVARLEGLEPNFMTPAEGEVHPLCQDWNANAFNVAAVHRVNICPGTLWQPDGILYEVFGHEISHDDDLCTLQNDFGQIDRPKLLAATEGPRFPPEVRNRLKEFYDLGDTHVTALMELFLDEPQTKSALKQAGIIKVIAPRLDHRPAVFAKIATCVAERYGYRTPTAAGREQEIARFKQNLSDLGGVDAVGEKIAVARLRRYFEEKPDCSSQFSRDRTQMNEGVADVVGTVLREKWNVEHPPRTEVEKMVGYVAGPFACRDRSMQVTDADLSPGNVTGSLSRHDKRTDDDHPASWKRVRMETDLPGLAAAAGCVRPEAGCFDHLSLIRSTAADASAASGARR